MNIKEKFEEQPWANALSYRKSTFLLMLEHFEIAAELGLTQIIETGTARSRGNWQGDGQSTLIWDWAIGEIANTKAISIDLNPQAVEVAQSQVSRVEFLVGDSIQALSNLSDEIVEKVGLLYLDSLDFDWSSGQVSSQHHLRELVTVWDRLPSGCMIVVDDCHSPYQGKHVAIASFMAGKEIPPAFAGYQMGWVKP